MKKAPIFAGTLGALTGFLLAFVLIEHGAASTRRLNDFIARNVDVIVKAASDYKIDPSVLVTIVAAEHTLNYNKFDDVENFSLRRRLDRFEEQWWVKWRTENEAKRKISEEQAISTGKRSAALLVSGYCMSYGPAQITPMTLFDSLNYFGQTNLQTKVALQGLLEEKRSWEFAATVVRYENDNLRMSYGTNICYSAGILASAYSMGHKRYVYWSGTSPKINSFGKWVQRNMPYYQELLEHQHKSTQGKH